MHALMLDKTVVDVATAPFPVAEPLFWTDCPNHVVAGYIFNGTEFVEKPILPKSKEQIQAECETVIEGFIDTKARERMYKSAESCISYLNSRNPQWAAEAEAFIVWRDDVYSYVIELQRKIEAREIAFNGAAALLENAPKMEWPTIV